VTALVAVACTCAYLAIALVTARWRYRAIRPYTEPLACETRSLHGGTYGHREWCYRRYGMIDTTGEAVAFALLLGLVWPFIAPAMAVRRFVISGDRVLPGELQAQIKRLEAENERLRREQAAP
jgi:hypothetical protein